MNLRFVTMTSLSFLQPTEALVYLYRGSQTHIPKYTHAHTDVHSRMNDLEYRCFYQL